MQGQSDYTWFKQYRFSPIFAQSLRISKAPAVARFPYYHVDLNAGSGFNEQAHVEGSPLNFLDAVRRTERHNFHAFFVDHDAACIAALTTRPEVSAHPSRVHIHRGDNAEMLPVVSEFIANGERNPQYAVGSIVIDPNGYHLGVPWNSVQVFCAKHRHFDVFVNLNISSWYKERPHIEQGKGIWGRHVLRPLSTFATWFSRPNWMWTDRTTVGGNIWIQAVGRSMVTHGGTKYRSLGFHDSQSEQGQAILAAIERPSTNGIARTNPQPRLLWDVS